MVPRRWVLPVTVERRDGFAPLIALVIDLAVPADLHLQIFGQRVDHRNPDTVEAAGNFIGAGIEFAAGVQAGHDHFHRRQIFAFVQIHGNAPAVVFYGDAVVRMDDDLDFVAMPAHGLVDGVVHHLVDQVVQAFRAGIADIHGRPFPHGLQALEDLNLAGAVFRVGGSITLGLTFVFVFRTSQIVTPFLGQKSILGDFQGAPDQIVSWSGDGPGSGRAAP